MKNTNEKKEEDILNPAKLNQPGKIQRILVKVAYANYVAAAVCALTALIFNSSLSKPVFSSFLASIVFFVGVGVVIQVIGSTSIPSFKVKN